MAYDNAVAVQNVWLSRNPYRIQGKRNELLPTCHSAAVDLKQPDHITLLFIFA